MEERLNFSQMTALVVDGDRFSSGIISQILKGFGVAHYTVAGTIEDAKKQLSSGTHHLLITECNLADGPLSNLVNWIRQSPKNELRYIPIVVLTGYTFYSWVITARDSGVNSVVRKPVSPQTLFDHIAWSARTDRPFIDADAYIGPCRRFRFGKPAPGFNRRVSDHPMDGPADKHLETPDETVT